MPRLRGVFAREIAARTHRNLPCNPPPQSCAAITAWPKLRLPFGRCAPCALRYEGTGLLTPRCARGGWTPPLRGCAGLGAGRPAPLRSGCLPPLRGSSVRPVLTKNAPDGAPASPFLVRPWRTRRPAALRAAPGFLAGIRGGFAPSQGRPFGLPSLRSAPPLPLRSSVPKKPGAARFARAGGASPPVRRTAPRGGLGSRLFAPGKGHANLSAALRGRFALSCPLPSAHRSTPPASAPPGPRPRGSGGSAGRLAPAFGGPPENHRLVCSWNIPCCRLLVLRPAIEYSAASMPRYGPNSR